MSSHPPAPAPGIDKLTEKSQVSEDGTLRSLEPTPQESSADGSPIVEVGDGDSHGGVSLGLPFFPGLCGVGWARVLWDYQQQRAETQYPGHGGVGVLSQTSPLFTGPKLKLLAFRLLIHQPYLTRAGLYPTSPVSP